MQNDLTNLTLSELIERSSLGTSRARALRRSTPREVVEEILAGLRALYEADP